MMDWGLSAIWILIEYGAFFLCWSSFLSFRYKKTTSAIIFVAWWLLALSLSNRGAAFPEKQIISLTLSFLVSTLLFRASWQKRALLTVMIYVTVALLDTAFIYGFASFLGVGLDELIWKKALYVTIVTIGKLFCLFLAWLVHHVRTIPPSQGSDSKWFLLMTMFPLVSLAMLAVLYDVCSDDFTLSHSAFLFSCILGVANVGILYVITMIEKDARRQQENSLLQQQMAIQTEGITALEKAYRAQRKLSHDFHHHLSTLASLLDQQEISMTREYLKQLLQTQSVRVLCVNSHNPIIDAILNQKNQLAVENHIDIQFQVNDLSNLHIQNEALVVLLSNILDNAIEACLKLDTDRCIDCTVLLQDSFYISVRNTTAPVQIVNGNIKSTKQTAHEHGYGIQNVRRIVHQLGGEVVFDYENGWFQLVADIPLISDCSIR